MQAVAAGLVVGVCAGYTLWTLLLPAALRHRLLRALGRPPRPAQCGGCDGCDGRAATSAPREQTLLWLPRRRG